MAEDKKKRIYRVALVVLGVIVAALIFNKILDKWSSFRVAIETIIGAAMPIIVGCVLAFLLNPILIFFDRVFHTLFQDKVIKDKNKLFKVSRTLSIIMTMILFLGALTGLLYLVIPQLYDSINMLVDNLPDYYQKVLESIDNIYAKFDKVNVSEDQIKTVVNTVYESVQDWAKNDVLPNMDKIVVNIGSGVIGGLKFVYNFLIGIIASIYIMANKEYLAARGKKVIYAVFKLENANLVLDGLGAVNRVFGQFINGKILDSVIIGLIAFIVLTIIQMPYALLISVIIGVTNIIPFFGPIIGAIPTVTIVLIADPFMSLVLLIFILILQQFDGNILGPKILGDSIGLSSFWILTAVIIGGGVFGFLGMLLAVPVFACCYMYINRSCTIKLKKNNMAYKTSEYERIVRIDNETGAPIYRSEEEEDIRFKKKTPEEKQRIKEEKKAARRIHVERHIKNESSENEAAATKDENDDK
jgi:predicted PurR-regulated permease PerM